MIYLNIAQTGVFGAEYVFARKYAKLRGLKTPKKLTNGDFPPSSSAVFRCYPDWFYQLSLLFFQISKTIF